MKTELHAHTSFSDGATTLENLFRHAKLSHVDYLAITDHDTIDGAKQAQILGDRYQIQVIPAVEISCFDMLRNRRVHMLCYYYKNADLLNQFLRRIQKNRIATANEMFRKVQQEIPINAEMVLELSADSFCIFKQHIMRVLMDMGYTNEMYGLLYQQLFHAKTGSCYMTPEFPDVYETIDLIHQAGGLAVMAHPSEYKSMDLLHTLVEKNLLDGIELWHPRNQEEDKEEISKLVRQYDLIATGGTDFHGIHSSRCHRIGTFTTPDEMFRRMQKHAEI